MKVSAKVIDHIAGSTMEQFVMFMEYGFLNQKQLIKKKKPQKKVENIHN